MEEEKVISSEEAFEIMDRAMPGDTAIRIFIHEYPEEE